MDATRPGIPLAPRPAGRWMGADARPRRVLVLLGAVALLSLADLAMTLIHLTGPGMLEANPVARQIMKYNSPELLIAWKLATVGLALGILIVARRRLVGELAAWFCFVVLAGLTVQWLVYNHAAPRMSPELGVLAEQMDPRWVSIDADR